MSPATVVRKAPVTACAQISGATERMLTMGFSSSEASLAALDPLFCPSTAFSCKEIELLGWAEFGVGIQALGCEFDADRVCVLCSQERYAAER